MRINGRPDTSYHPRIPAVRSKSLPLANAYSLPRSLSSVTGRIPQEIGGGYDGFDPNTEAPGRDSNQATVQPGPYGVVVQPVSVPYGERDKPREKQRAREREHEGEREGQSRPQHKSRGRKSREFVRSPIKKYYDYRGPHVRDNTRSLPSGRGQDFDGYSSRNALSEGGGSRQTVGTPVPTNRAVPVLITAGRKPKQPSFLTYRDRWSARVKRPTPPQSDRRKPPPPLPTIWKRVRNAVSTHSTPAVPLSGRMRKNAYSD
jgi:hypothetical protein